MFFLGLDHIKTHEPLPDAKTQHTTVILSNWLMAGLHFLPRYRNESQNTRYDLSEPEREAVFKWGFFHLQVHSEIYSDGIRGVCSLKQTNILLSSAEKSKYYKKKFHMGECSWEGKCCQLNKKDGRWNKRRWEDISGRKNKKGLIYSLQILTGQPLATIEQQVQLTCCVGGAN